MDALPNRPWWLMAIPSSAWAADMHVEGAIATAPTTVLQLPLAAVEKAELDEPAIHGGLMRSLASQHKWATLAVRRLSHRSVLQRLASHLAENAAGTPEGSLVAIPQSKRALAEESKCRPWRRNVRLRWMPKRQVGG